jgi:hypothetical protein
VTEDARRMLQRARALAEGDAEATTAIEAELTKLDG